MPKINIRSASSTMSEGGFFQAERSRGTVDSPALVQNGDTLGGVLLTGYDGTNYVESGRIVSVATENWENGSVGSRLEFYTTDNDTETEVKAFSILEDGAIVFGDAVTSGYKMDVDGNVRISGDLFIDGTSFITTTETVEIADNLLVINYGELGAGVTNGTAGLQVDRGSLTDYLLIFDEASDHFRVGEVGDTQAVATREDTPTGDGIAVWNNAEFRYDTYSGLTYTGGKLTLTSGTGINEFSTDATMSGESDDAVPTEAAVKSYVDTSISNIIADGTAVGQLLFWNGSSWTYMETSELFWDDTNKRVGIGTSSPATTLDVDGYVTLASGTGINEFSTDGTLADDSDDAVPTEKAVKAYVDDNLPPVDDGTAAGQMSFWDGASWTYTSASELFWDDTNKRVGIGTATPANTLDVNGTLILQSGTSINEFSTDGTLADASDDAVPTEKAVRTYVDNAIPQLEDGTATGQLTFWDGNEWTYTETTELFWDDTNKRVGIGTATPATALDVEGYVTLSLGTAINEFSTDGTLAGDSDDAVPTEKAVKAYVDDNAANIEDGTAAGQMAFWNGSTWTYTNATELYWNDTNKDLGIGTVLDESFTARLTISDDDAASAGLAAYGHESTDGQAPLVYLAKSRGTKAAETIVASGDTLGKWQCAGYDGASYLNAALIRAVVDGTPGSSDMPTRLEFQVTADGESNTTERMRLNNEGKLALGDYLGLDQEWNSGLTMTDDGGTSISSITQYRYDNGASGSGIWASKARGSQASPSVPNEDDTILYLSANTWDGDQNLNAAIISFKVGGTVSDNVTYGDIIFYTADNSAGASERMRLNSDGSLQFVTGTNINEFSTDGTLADDSDDAVPTEKAVKTYVDNNIPPVDDGTAAGQMAFWDGASWTYTNASELYWDDTNKRVGIGTSSPATALDVDGALSVEIGTSINTFSTDVTLGDGTASDDVLVTQLAIKTYIDNQSTPPGGVNGNIQFNDNGDFGGESDLFWEATNNNLGLGTTSEFAGGAGIFAIANADTVPNTDPTGGGVMYVEGGAAKWRSPSGTITTFGPADPHCPVCGKDYMLEFQNDNDYFAMCLPCLAAELGSRDWILTKK